MLILPIQLTIGVLKKLQIENTRYKTASDVNPISSKPSSFSTFDAKFWQVLNAVNRVINAIEIMFTWQKFYRFIFFLLSYISSFIFNIFISIYDIFY